MICIVRSISQIASIFSSRSVGISRGAICFHPRKHIPLPYKWPLLEDKQDPSSLEARLAFHLHRLHLTGAPLRIALNGKSRISTALTQARIGVSISTIADLAARLGVSTNELLRGLSEPENREWEFYRQSAQHRAHVWREAIRISERRGYSQRELARIAGIPQSRIREALVNKPRGVLDWTQADRLLQAFGCDAPPESLLPDRHR